MRRHIRFTLWVGLLAASAAVVTLLWRDPEPSYKGKPLSEWLRAYDNATANRAEADKAIRAIGPKAIPGLLQMLGDKDSRLKLALIKLAKRQNLVRVEIELAVTRRWRASCALKALGPQATVPLPELARLLRDPTTAFDAVHSLVETGPDAVVLLREGLTNQNADVRSLSAGGLMKAGSNAAVAVPELAVCLKDPNLGVRWQAASALGAIGQQPDVAIPALVESLQDTKVRLLAVMALGRFGAQATSAVPAIQKAMSNAAQPDGGFGTVAKRALRDIDREAAAKTGAR